MDRPRKVLLAIAGTIAFALGFLSSPPSTSQHHFDLQVAAASHARAGVNPDETARVPAGSTYQERSSRD